MSGRRRPFRMMVRREWVGPDRDDWAELDPPKCSTTFTTREAAEAAVRGWWGELSRAYVDPPEPGAT